MNRNQIRTKVKQLINKANKMYRLEMDMPTISFFSKGTRAGWSMSDTNSVGFNEVLAQENSEQFKAIVIHEVAHLVTDTIFPNAKRPHGKEFQVIDMSLGGEGFSNHDFDTRNVEVKRKHND